jgi:hypothetical protein
MQSFQVAEPLSLALSPSDGEREKSFVVNGSSHRRFKDSSQKAYSLSPSDGERARERGSIVRYFVLPSPPGDRLAAIRQSATLRYG